MDNFNLFHFETGVNPVPVQSTKVGGEKVTVLEGTFIINDKLVIGNPPNYPSSMGTSYLFPSSLGSINQVLISNPTESNLIWANQTGGGGGSGDIVNGGQSGAVTIGTTSSDDLTLISAGKINIGDITTDEIHLQGGIRFQYDAISDTVPSGGNTFNLLLSNYFVEITGSGISTVHLPDADGAVSGHMYIISKGYAGGTIAIKPTPGSGDTIDGLSQVNLTSQDQRLKVISSGSNRWLII